MTTITKGIVTNKENQDFLVAVFKFDDGFVGRTALCLNEDELEEVIKIALENRTLLFQHKTGIDEILSIERIYTKDHIEVRKNNEKYFFRLVHRNKYCDTECMSLEQVELLLKTFTETELVVYLDYSSYQDSDTELYLLLEY